MRRFVCILISMLLVLMTVGSFNVCNAAELVTDGENFYSQGDANGDGVIDVRDLVKMKKYIVGTSNDITFVAADLDCDDQIVARDLTLLKHILLGVMSTDDEVAAWSGIY